MDENERLRWEFRENPDSMDYIDIRVADMDYGQYEQIAFVPVDHFQPNPVEHARAEAAKLVAWLNHSTIDVDKVDQEECGACHRLGDLCGYHEGYAIGMRDLADSLTAWFANGFEGDPIACLFRERRAGRAAQAIQRSAAQAHESWIADEAGERKSGSMETRLSSIDSEGR